ncbi:MAG: TonB-dependent receptor [Bacteroidota bacterium]|nr:TonB-dependent receptor [Bacteroidota bacterium]
MLSKKLLQSLLALLLPVFLMSQTTTSSLGGVVKTITGEPLVGAAIKVTHEPTGTVYRTQSRSGGRFDVANLSPGGPYSIEVTFLNFAVEKQSDIYLNLGENFKVDVAMAPKVTDLGTVTVTGAKKTTEFASKGGTEVTIGRDKVANLPTVGRNIYDYLRAVPQARLVGGTEGAVTIAGQNNRYNSFYVDGAINNDVFGLAASGTNGGQANNAAPISIDAIDQFQVVISPYDASQGNFTGGGINAITRSGTNKIEGSVYYFFRNQNLAGKDPTVDKSVASRFPDFNNKVYGFRIGGPIIKNKLFYFLSLEQQKDETPQPFDFTRYLGNTNTPAAMQTLTDYVKNTYGYDMGSYLQTTKKLDVDRLAAKVDWNVSDKHKLSVSYRYNNPVATNPSLSSSTSINFGNGAVYFPNKTNSVSAELKSLVGRSSTNKLLVTYSSVIDDRGIVGSPFPRVSIVDGSGSINFGSENSSTQNLLKQKNFSLVDHFKFNIGKHAMTLGLDYEYFDDLNVFIQNTFGNYRYGNVAAFIANNAAPTSYQLGFPLTDQILNDNTNAAAKFKVAKGAAFWNDEFRVSDNLTLNIGIRGDLYQFLSVPATDKFTNDSALPKFSQYYDLRGARSGLKPNIPLSISPRIGFTYKIPEENLVIRGGFGVFSGRMPLVWPGGVYNNNGLFVGGYSASASTNPTLSSIRFRWDPNNITGSVWASGPGTKGPLNLISKDFKMPKLWRTSLAIDKKWGEGWSGTIEGIFSKNINEIDYYNINILPPVGKSLGAGSRNVYNYASSSSASLIPIRSNGTNPYDNAILVTNNDRGQKGFAYNFSLSIDKKTRTGFNFSFNYAFGNSIVLNEATSSVNLSQWRFMETVNGRNYINTSISDFSQGHRIFALLSKKFTYANKAMATTISLVYTGQSGTPISYVYGSQSMTRDDGSNGGNDLVYIPTATELQAQTFLSNTVGSGSSAITYTPQQQKDALEAFIQGSPYLRNHRGQFAERNGDRLPFTNIVDLKIAQDFNIKVSGHRYQFQLTWDVFNFTNMLNRNWGRSFFASNDQFSLINFAGYVSASNLTPQYRFNPQITRVWNYNNSVTPAYANRWVSQLGVRFNF